MKARKFREDCLKSLAWLPVGICIFLVGWSYLVFTLSVCGYLFTHDHAFQGAVYVIMITGVAVLMLWSYFLATFSSPGYPSEILRQFPRYNSSVHGDVGLQDQDDGVHAGLLEPGQYHLSPSTSATSPLVDHRRSHSRHHSGMDERFSDERTDRDHAHDSWSQETYLANDQTPSQHHSGAAKSSTSSVRKPHTAIRMPDDELNGQTIQNYEVQEADDERDDNKPLGLSIRRFTVKRDGKKRYCQKCKFEKPDRTHHCSSCKRCVLKMDHHCPWLNNCVGHNNYKAFYLFVVWTAIYCIVLVACTIPVTAEVIRLPYSETFFDPQWIFMILAGLIFGLCLVPFAIHHTLLIKSNKTTIESFEKHKYRMGTNGQVMQSRVLNVFDLGKKKNFVQVLGPVWYLWLVPVRNSAGNGWTFPANDLGKSMLHVDEDIDPTYGVHPSRDQASWPHQHDHSSSMMDQHDQDYHFDLTDTDDLDRRRDSDESDLEDHRSYIPPTPRRFRQGFAPTRQQDSEDEGAEEYLYDSDEPATIRFTDHGRSYSS